MAKNTNTKPQSIKTRRILAFVITIVLAVALAITGILCFGVNKGRNIENEVGSGDQSAATSHDVLTKWGKTLNVGTQVLNNNIKDGDILNLKFCATLNAKPAGVNAYWKNRQNGYVANSGMYTITLPVGKYKFELWGAQGGNSRTGITTSHQNGAKVLTQNYVAYGGMGAYATGTLELTQQTTIYIQVGGQGTSSLDNPYNVIRGGGYNGGGGVINDGNGGGGGGATDVRIASNTVNNRILVAGGGGGASWGASNPGGYAGGAGSGEHGYLTQNVVNGASMLWWGAANSTVGGGGTQTHGGYWLDPWYGNCTNHNNINNEVRNTSKTHGSSTYSNGTGASIATASTEGTFGQGGNGAGAHWAGGAGGGGWYGGAGGYVHTGGGGSSFARTASTPAASMPASYAYRTVNTYNLTDTNLVAGNDTRLRSGGALANPGGTGWATGGRVCLNMGANATTAITYPTSHAGYGWGDEGGDGYARITVVNTNFAPTTKNTNPTEFSAGKRGKDKAIEVKAADIAKDPVHDTTVHFTNGVSTNLDTFSSDFKLYLDANCTIDATAKTLTGGTVNPNGYVSISVDPADNTKFTITEVYKYPRAGTYATVDGTLRLYARVRDEYNSNTKRGVTAIPFDLKVDKDDVTTKAFDTKSGVELYADDDTGANANIYNNFYLGLSSTDVSPDQAEKNATPSNPAPTYDENYIYNPNGENIYTALLKQPLRLPNLATGVKNPPVVLKAADIFEGLNATVNDALGLKYDDAIFALDVSKITPSDTSRFFRVVEHDEYVQTPSKELVAYNKNGTRILNAYRQITLEGVNSYSEYQVLPVTVYVLENNAAGGLNYECKYTQAFTLQIVVKVDNTRPRLKTSKDVDSTGATAIDPPVVTLNALETTTVDLNDLFIDDDNTKIDGASHRITAVKVAEYEYIQLDKYGNVASTVDNYSDGAGAYYNIVGGTLPGTTVLNTAFKEGWLKDDGGTYETGFQSWYISTSLSSGNSFVRYAFNDATLSLTGLRATYPLFKSARDGGSYNTIVSGSKNATITTDNLDTSASVKNAGDFYILVKLLDYNDTDDEGIWLPIGIRVENTNPTDTSTERNQPGASDLPTAEGGVDKVFYFTPMGITYNLNLIPLGAYEVDGALSTVNLKPLGSDADNFVIQTTDGATMVYGGALNELLIATSTADDVTRKDDADFNNEKYYKVEEIPIYVRKAYFSSNRDNDNSRLDLANYENVFAANKTFDGVEYVAIRGYKITLLGWTHNRYVYAPVTLEDSQGETVDTYIAVKVTNSTPNGLEAGNVAEYNYTNSATGVSASAKYEATKDDDVINGTITFKIPEKSSVIITPYDLLTDKNMTDFGVTYPASGFTLNGFRGTFASGKLTADRSVNKKTANALIGLANSDAVLYGGSGTDYSSVDYFGDIKTTLDQISKTRKLATVSQYNTFDSIEYDTNGDMIVPADYDNVGYDRLFFERTNDASNLDGFTFDPYSAANSSYRNSFATPTITNGTYVSYSFGSELAFPAGYFGAGEAAVSYGIDYIVITGGSRTPSGSPVVFTMTVRDRTGASATGDASGIKTFKINIEVVNSTPTLKETVRPVTMTTAVTSAGDYTIRTINATDILEDNESDDVAFYPGVDGDHFRVVTIDDDGTEHLYDGIDADKSDPDESKWYYGKKFLGDYINVEITDQTIKITALNSTQNIKALYLVFYATDGRDSTTQSELKVRVEVFNTAPTTYSNNDAYSFESAYVSLGNNTYLVDNLWAVSSTTTADQTAARYFASSQSAIDAIKANPSVNDTQVKRLVGDTDKLQGAILSPRIEVGANTNNVPGDAFDSASPYIGRYINAPSGTTDYKDYVPYVDELTGNGTGNFPVAVKVTWQNVSKNIIVDTSRPISDYATFDIVYFVDIGDGKGVQAYNASDLRDDATVINDEMTANAAKPEEDRVYHFFDEKGRWLVTDWAVVVNPILAFPNGYYLTLSVKVRDELRYGGDTAGLAKVSDFEYIFSGDNDDKFPAATIRANDPTVGFSEISYRLNVKATGIVTYDYYDRFGGYYTVNDVSQSADNYISVYDSEHVTGSSATSSKALYFKKNGSTYEFEMKTHDGVINDIVKDYIDEGVKYDSTLTEEDLSKLNAFKYSHTIEVPSSGTQYIPMSYFALNGSVISKFENEGSDKLPYYDPDTYVAYNVQNENGYYRGIFDNIASAITLTDGKNVYTGVTDDADKGTLSLNKNPYVDFTAYDACDSNGKLITNTNDSDYKAYEKTLTGPYFNDKIAISTYKNSDAPIQDIFYKPSGGFSYNTSTNKSNNLNFNNVVAGGKLLYLADQKSKLQEHLFGIGITKDKTRINAADLTVTIDVAYCNRPSSGNGDTKAPEGNDDQLTATVSFKLHVANSEVWLDGSLTADAKKGVKYDDKVGYYTEVRLTNGDGRYEVGLDRNNADTNTTSNTVVEYNDADSLDSAYFSLESTYKLSAWNSNNDYKRTKDLSATTFNNTYNGTTENAHKYAQYSMARYFGYDGRTFSADEATTVGKYTTNYQPNGGIFGTNYGAAGSGREGYSKYFGLAASDDNTKLYITPYAKTIINPDAYSSTGYESNVGDMYKARGLVPVYDGLTIKEAYYPLRVLIYDDCGEGWNEASYVSLEIRVYIDNDKPEYTRILANETYTDESGVHDVGNGNKVLNISLAVSDIYQFNLREIIYDADMLKDNNGNWAWKSYYDGTVIANAKDAKLKSTSLSTWADWAFKADTGDYLVSPFSMENYLETGSVTTANNHLIAGTAKFGNGNAEDADQSDIIMYMPYSNPGSADQKTLLSTSNPQGNAISIKVNRRTTYTTGSGDNISTVNKSKFLYTLNFKDSAGASTATLTINITINNKIPEALIGMGNSVRMRVGDSFTVLTTPYDYFFDGSNSSNASNTVRKYYDSRTNRNENMPNGDGTFSIDGYSNLTFENIRTEVGKYRLHDFDDPMIGSLEEGGIENTTVEGSTGSHLGYTAIADDDTPWSLRITSVSDNLSSYLNVTPRDSVLYEKDGRDAKSIDYIFTANGKVCTDLPVTLTLTDDENGGILQYTIYVTVESTEPSAVVDGDDDHPLAYGLFFDENSNSADAGVYGLYMTAWTEDGATERIVNLGNSTNHNDVTAFSELKINVASNVKDDPKESGGLAYDPDITDHSKLGLYVPADGKVFTINDEAMERIDSTDPAAKTVTFVGNNFQITTDKAFTYLDIRCLSYDRESDEAELRFYVADMSDNKFSRSRPITIKLTTLYSAMSNSHDAKNTVPSGGQFIINDSQVDRISVKSYQAFINEPTVTPSVYRLLDYSGNNGVTGQESVSKPRIEDNDVMAGNATLRYDLKIYAFIDRSGTSYECKSAENVSSYMSIDPTNGYFRLTNPNSTASDSPRNYLIGGRQANGNSWSGINQNILSYTQRYFSFSIGSDGVSLNFRPVTATFDAKILFYVELEKSISSDRHINPYSDEPKKAGTLFYVSVDDSAPIANENKSVLQFKGKKGDSKTFKIFDMDDPYMSLFTDTDSDDEVFVNGFSSSSGNVDKDYEAALGGNSCDWRTAPGRNRALEIVSDNENGTLTIKILRRIDEPDGNGGFLTEVPVDVVITGTDRSGEGESTPITIRVTVCNTDPTIDLEALKSYKFNDRDVITTDMTSRFNVDGMGYTIAADEGNNKFVVDTYVSQDGHGYNPMVADNAIGTPVLDGNLKIETMAWLSDPDYTTVAADTESFRLVDGPLSLKEYYVTFDARTSGIPVYKRNANGYATEEVIATVTPTFTNGNSMYFTGFTITARTFDRGASGYVYMRIIDRSGDESNQNNGITLQINVTILNSAPTIVAGKDELSFDFVGSTSKEVTAQKFSIVDLVTDVNPNDRPTDENAKVSSTYLRIIGVYGETPEQMFSTVDLDTTDLIATFTFSDSGDETNRTCVITPIIGVFGTQVIHLTIADGDTSRDSTAKTITLSFRLTIAYPFDEIGQLNSVSTYRGMTTKINTKLLVKEMENHTGTAGGVSASAEGDVEMFNPGAGYVVTRLYAPNSYVDYVTIDQDKDGVWQFRARQNAEKIHLNVEFKLESDKDKPDAKVYDSIFEVRIDENPKPKLIQAFEDVYTFFSSGSGYVLNSEGTVYLAPENLFTDNEGDIMKFTSAKSKAPSLVSVELISEESLAIKFNAKGETSITIAVADTTEESIPYTFTVKNIDLPDPSLWMTIRVSFESNKFIWVIIIGAVILAIIILIIVIIALRRRARKRQEIEELLISEMELEEQMMRIAAAANNPYQTSYGFMPPPPTMNVQDPGLMLNAGGGAGKPNPDVLNLNPGQAAGGQPTNGQPNYSQPANYGQQPNYSQPANYGSQPNYGQGGNNNNGLPPDADF